MFGVAERHGRDAPVAKRSNADRFSCARIYWTLCQASWPRRASSDATGPYDAPRTCTGRGGKF
jgi:hypothetical protein